MRGGKEMSDILYSPFRKTTDEMGMDGSDYSKAPDAGFNMVVTK
jgi:hypothetical protein